LSHNRIIYLILSDTHGGNELGLVNPEIALPKQDLDQTGSLRVTETNKFLWEDIFVSGLQKVCNLAGDDPIIALHNGDLAHGIKYMDETIDSSMVVQFVVAVENMKRVLEIPNVVMLRLISGTASHSFGQGSVDAMAAYTLRGMFPGRDIQSYHHDLLDINGFTIDCAHKGPNTGKRNWTKGNIARLYLQSMMEDELALGNTPPKLVLRSHYHEYIKVWHGKKYRGEYLESWLIVSSPLCLIGDWTRDRTESAYIVSPGMLALEVVDGHLYQTHFFGQTMDIRRKETITL
jgi:hypothetical protein